jgi:hypothetical protein
MKKNFAIIIMLSFFAFNSSAQIKKGSQLIGFNYGLGALSVYGDVNNISDFKPYYTNMSYERGCFIANRLAIGAKVGFFFGEESIILDATSANYSAANRTSNNYVLTPFMRYYFNPNGRLKLFYELNLTGGIYRWQTTDSRLVNNKLVGTKSDWKNYRTVQIDNSIGVNYFLGQNLAIEGSLNYIYYFKGVVNDNSQSPTEISFPKLQLNPELRMRFFLNTDKKDSEILAKEYLKKGNLTFGVKGLSFFKDAKLMIFSPSVGYFLTDKLLIGSALEMRYQKDFYRYFGLAPEMRFYQPITKNAQILLRGAYWAGISHDISSRKTGSEFIKGNAEIQAGFNRFIADNISIQALIDAGPRLDNNKLKFNPNIQFGFQYFMR